MLLTFDFKVTMHTSGCPHWSVLYDWCLSRLPKQIACRIASTWSSVSDLLDLCLNESFNVSCGGDQVILITSAVFGRMRPGRCISGDFNLGCSKDVKSIFDAQCSARQSCDVSIRGLVELHPCQRDFVSYLEASYTCIEGKTLILMPVTLSLVLKVKLFSRERLWPR